MSLMIQTNVEAFDAHRNLVNTENQLAQSMSRLSSGYRINSAADDAAGLAISERLQAQIGGLDQAQRNIQDGVSLVQTAEGSLTQVHAMLQRVRDLAVQYQNGTLSTTDQQAIQSEVNQLSSEIERIGSSAQFNGISLLSSTTTIYIQVGVSLVQTAEGSLTQVHAMLQRVRDLAVQYQNGTLSTTDQQAIQSEVNQLSSEIERIGSSAQFNGISLLSSTTTISFQVGANNGDSIAVTMISLGQTVNTASFSLASASGISSIDAAINAVSAADATFGAVENRLQYTLSNASIYEENLTSSESRIRDVDMASEMVNFTKLQILQQAGTSMLSQANQLPQSVLTLLR